MRDKLLNWSLIVSVIVNLIFIVMVGNSDIFQVQQTKQDLVTIHKFHVVKPPIKKKPPPPKKKPPPPQHVVKQVTPPPPTPQIVRPTQVVKIVTPPVPAVKSEPAGKEVVPGPTTAVTPPSAPEPPTPPQPQPTPPQPQPTPQPQPRPVVKPPPPAAPSIPDRAEAIPITDFQDDITSGIQIDTQTLASTTIVVRFDVGPDGLPHNFKVTTSSGNNDLDQAAIDACKKVRFKPAINGGEPVESRFSHTFTVST